MISLKFKWKEIQDKIVSAFKMLLPSPRQMIWLSNYQKAGFYAFDWTQNKSSAHCCIWMFTTATFTSFVLLSRCLCKPFFLTPNWWKSESIKSLLHSRWVTTHSDLLSNVCVCGRVCNRTLSCWMWIIYRFLFGLFLDVAS